MPQVPEKREQPTPEPAWLREAFSAQPLPPIPILPTLNMPIDQEPEKPESRTRGPHRKRSSRGCGVTCCRVRFSWALWCWSGTLPRNWPAGRRVTEARGEAEAAYLKRRAELRAESEHGVEWLQVNNLKELDFKAVVMKVKPLVVTVTNLVDPGLRQNDPFNPRRVVVYDPVKDKKYWQISVGSGFIVKPGYILTNHHVVSDKDQPRIADQLRITFASGQTVLSVPPPWPAMS